jgi:hypothetical protein
VPIHAAAPMSRMTAVALAHRQRERHLGGDLVNAHVGVADLASFAKATPTPTPLSQGDALAVVDYQRSVAASAARQAALAPSCRARSL